MTSHLANSFISYTCVVKTKDTMMNICFNILSSCACIMSDFSNTIEPLDVFQSPSVSVTLM